MGLLIAECEDRCQGLCKRDERANMNNGELKPQEIWHMREMSCTVVRRPHCHVSQTMRRFEVSMHIAGTTCSCIASHGSHQPSTSWAPGLLKSGMRVYPLFPTRIARISLIALSWSLRGRRLCSSSTLRGRRTADVRTPYTPSRRSPRFHEQLSTGAGSSSLDNHQRPLGPGRPTTCSCSRSGRGAVGGCTQNVRRTSTGPTAPPPEVRRRA